MSESEATGSSDEAPRAKSASVRLAEERVREVEQALGDADRAVALLLAETESADSFDEGGAPLSPMSSVPPSVLSGERPTLDGGRASVSSGILRMRSAIPIGTGRGGTRDLQNRVSEAHAAHGRGLIPPSTPSWARDAAVNGEHLAPRPASGAGPGGGAPARRRSTAAPSRRRMSLTGAKPLPIDARSIEAVRDAAVLSAPISDVALVPKGGADPAGSHFYRLTRSVGDRKACLNSGSVWGRETLLWLRKDVEWRRTPIVALAVILPDRGEFVPPGYAVLRQGGAPVDLNEGTSGERVLLCKRVGVGNPITDVQLVFPKKGERVPKGYSIIDRTPLGHSANLNLGHSGTPVYLAYKQLLRNLQPLALDALAPHAEGPSTAVDSNASDRSDTPPEAPPPPTPTPTPTPTPSYSEGAADLAPDAAEEAPRPRAGSSWDEDPFHGGGRTGVVLSSGQVEDPSKRRALRSLAFALYVRQGAAAGLALRGLLELLESDFFEGGLGGVPPEGWTLLEVLVDAVCDRAELLLEADLEACCQVLGLAAQRGEGSLGPWAQMRLVRALQLCCVFHASRDPSWVARDHLRPYHRRGGTPRGYSGRAFEALRGLVAAQMRALGGAGAGAGGVPEGVPPGGVGTPTPTPAALCGGIVAELIEDVLEHADLSAGAHRLLGIVLRGGGVGTDAHWLELHGLSRALFASEADAGAVALLAGLCKVAAGPLRPAGEGRPVARDLAAKLIGLELLGELLSIGPPEYRSSVRHGYLVRRLVATTVLQNAPLCLVDERVLGATLRTCGCLWRHFRRHLRLELAVICDAVLLPLLREGPPASQGAVLRELLSWFENSPQHLVELFLNFDLAKSARDWKVFAPLCEALSAIAEADGPAAGPGPEEGPGDAESARALRFAALDAVAQISRSLMDASGHAHLILNDARTRALSSQASGGWELEEGVGGAHPPPGGGHPPPPARSSSIMVRQSIQQREREKMQRALEIYRGRGLAKAVRYLVATNFLSETPRDVASFLRLYAHELSAEDIGDLLGEGGATEADEKYWNLVRLSYVSAISFIGMRFEAALRHYLTNCGFIMPGEAQKIDRILSTFCLRYWADNQGTPRCPFRHEDTVFVVAFAAIMLNTDLHRANADAKNRKRRMTKQEFQRNLRGVDGSADLDPDFLSALYDQIEARPIVIGGRDAAQDDGDGSEAGGVLLRRRSALQRKLRRRIRQGEELLAGLNLTAGGNRFALVGVDSGLSLELLRVMFEGCWFHFHGVVNDALEGPSAREASHVLKALDVLRYALSAAIFLDSDTIRAAFATQLAKFRLQLRGEAADETYLVQGKHLEEPWFKEILDAARHDAWESIAKVHKLFLQLKARVREDRQRLELETLSRRIVGAKVIEGSRVFLREGELTKLCRSGKRVQYTFFLFSDALMYAHQTLVGQYKVHAELPVSVMKVEDAGGAQIHIHHPRKSFRVQAPDDHAKRAWLRALNDAVEAARDKRRFDQRLSIIPRLVDQGSRAESIPVARMEAAAPAGDPEEAKSLPPAPLEGRRLDSAFRRAAAAAAKLMAVDGDGGASGANKRELYGLLKQAEHGDWREDRAGKGGGEEAEAKAAAWRAMAGVGRDDARRRFVTVMDALKPDWDSEPLTPAATPRVFIL